MDSKAPVRPQSSSIAGGPQKVSLDRPPLHTPIVISPTANRGGKPIGGVVPKVQVRVEDTPTDSSGAVLGSEWERVDLPSRFIPYEWNDLSIKRFGVMDHAKVARAVKARNTSIMLDVLSSCCNRDVRELVWNDFQSVVIWHKVNSYINTPYTISWNSRYGARGNVTVRATELRETPLEKTREQYREWRAKGFALPTARDIEAFETIKESQEDVLFLFERAQWVDIVPLK